MGRNVLSDDFSTSSGEETYNSWACFQNIQTATTKSAKYIALLKLLPVIRAIIYSMPAANVPGVVGMTAFASKGTNG